MKCYCCVFFYEVEVVIYNVFFIECYEREGIKGFRRVVLDFRDELVGGLIGNFCI